MRKSVKLSVTCYIRKSNSFYCSLEHQVYCRFNANCSAYFWPLELLSIFSPQTHFFLFNFPLLFHLSTTHDPLLYDEAGFLLCKSMCPYFEQRNDQIQHEPCSLNLTCRELQECSLALQCRQLTSALLSSMLLIVQDE